MYSTPPDYLKHAALFPRVRRALPACYVLAAPYLSPARGPSDGTACSADSPRRVQALPLEACTLRPVIAGLPPDARPPLYVVGIMDVRQKKWKRPSLTEFLAWDLANMCFHVSPTLIFDLS